MSSISFSKTVKSSIGFDAFVCETENLSANDDHLHEYFQTPDVNIMAQLRAFDRVVKNICCISKYC